MTTFQILMSTETGVWQTAGVEEAHSSKSACEKAYLKAPEPSIRGIVAVPERSWRPTPIGLEERPPKVVFGDGGKTPEGVREGGEESVNPQEPLEPKDGLGA